MFSLFIILTAAIVTLPHIYSAVEVQVAEIKQRVLQLEEDERQLQASLEEKIRETGNLQEINPQLQAMIDQLKRVLLLNHQEKERELKEARGLLAGIPEVEQSQIIRRLHMERWVKVYPHLVLHMKKEIPLVYEDNRFNVTLRLALTSGDQYKPEIKEYKKEIEMAKAMIEVYGNIINNQIKQLDEAVSVYSKEEKCPLNFTQFNLMYLNTVEEHKRKQIEKANFIIETGKKMKVLMKKRYNIIVESLKKMLPNKMFEDEEKDVVRKLINETVTTIKTIDEEMNDRSILTNTEDNFVKVKSELAKALQLSKDLENSEACKRYQETLKLNTVGVKKNLMKLAFLKKVSASSF